MARGNRRRAYGKRKRGVFSKYGRPYGRGRDRDYGYSGRRPREGLPGANAAVSEADVTVSIGSRRIWLFNNTQEDIVIPAGAYVVLEIVHEGEGRVGYRYRAVLLNGAEEGREEAGEEAGGPEERLEDWV
jgi:hypothetical protein